MTMNSYILIFIFSFLLNRACAIGINYGVLGDNLPPPATVVAELIRRHVSKVRLFDPNPDILTALHNSGISVIIGTQNGDLQPISADPAAAAQWVASNVLPHAPFLKIESIAAGNEVYPGELTQFLPGAIENLKSALIAAGLTIPITTAVSMQVLSAPSFPPSQGAFKDDFAPVMTRIASVLSADNTPLLVNAYPYYARTGDPDNVDLNFALFADGAAVVNDGELVYRNLFDSMVDAVYAALEKVGGAAVGITVAETGWPSDGGADASVENAQAYVNNLIGRVSSEQGTPRRPEKAIDAYIFSMFNEDLKGEGIEQHWGLYYPDLTEVYHVNL